MKNTPSPNPRQGGDDDPPITIRINLLIHEHPKPSGSGHSGDPRINKNHRSSSNSAPVTSDGTHTNIPTNPTFSRQTLPGSEDALPMNNSSSSPLALEGTIDRNRLAALLREKQRTSAAEPDIEITLVLYV